VISPSSLLNCLLQKPRSVVNDLAGTTHDPGDLFLCLVSAIISNFSLKKAVLILISIYRYKVEEKVRWDEEIVGTKPYLAYRVVPKDKRIDAKNEETCSEEEMQQVEAKITALSQSPAASLAIGNKRTFEITFVDTGWFGSFVHFEFCLICHLNVSWHPQEINASM
jgi:hypothetical protein